MNVVTETMAVLEFRATDVWISLGEAVLVWLFCAAMDSRHLSVKLSLLKHAALLPLFWLCFVVGMGVLRGNSASGGPDFAGVFSIPLLQGALYSAVLLVALIWKTVFKRIVRADLPASPVGSK